MNNPFLVCLVWERIAPFLLLGRAFNPLDIMGLLHTISSFFISTYGVVSVGAEADCESPMLCERTHT